jgi:hypothetical protein
MLKVNRTFSWDVAIAGTKNKQGDMSVATKTFPVSVEGRPFTLTVFWTGTPTGPITIEFSSDHDPSDRSDPHNGHWDSVNAQLVPVPTAPAGAAGQYNVSPEPLRTLYVRVAFAPSAGSGAIVALWSFER